MTNGTKLFLVIFAIILGILIVYYGVVSPGDRRAALNTDNSVVAHDPLNEKSADALPSAFAERTMPVRERPQPVLASSLTGVLSESVRQASGGTTTKESEVTPIPQDQFDQGTFVGRTTMTPLATLNKRSRVWSPASNSQPAEVASNDSPEPVTTDYTVKSGDTLSSIAEEWFGDANKWSLIAEVNPTIEPSRMQIGQKLQLPAKENPKTPMPAVKTSSESVYVVRSGDSLAKIAREQYDNQGLWKLIFDANKSIIGSDPASITPGMKLRIPDQP